MLTMVTRPNDTRQHDGDIQQRCLYFCGGPAVIENPKSAGKLIDVSTRYNHVCESMECSQSASFSLNVEPSVAAAKGSRCIVATPSGTDDEEVSANRRC